MEKQQKVSTGTTLIKAHPLDNLQSGTWRGKEATSQGPSLARALIKPRFNVGWGFGEGRNVFLSGARGRHSDYSGQPPPLAGRAAVITLWANSLN